ncbi:sensor histidine kinase [Massilia glaciei]|uniref:histidine kinase n=1 Tax=Massilia glaciei TaxID=1524097 RepID=A0A2U2HIN7_9BURK|nr:HAMP domain-containing sensor histidine kinase [Massilia glaciei]PWF46663.1 sensor histidine kinase [Massilia glaciei]
MRRAESLRRRIVVAYLAFASGASLLFALIAVVAVEGIEVHLVDDRLAEIAAWASPRHAGRLPVEMPTGLSFHHGDAIPTSLRRLPPGVQEVAVDGIRLRVFAGKDGAGDYVVVDHESDYEKVELVVFSLFGLGFLGFLALSMLFGGFVAHRVVTPITTLASAVLAGSDDLPLLDSHDELGVLSRAFAAHTRQLRDVLERERLFTGDVSHELRTPLTVIIGAAEILLARPTTSPAERAPAERILRAANEAAECVSILLLLARSPELIAMPPLSASQVCQDEVLRFQGLVVAKPVVLGFAGGDDFTVHAPTELCRAVVGNLIRNACQYTEAGAVVVRLGPRTIVVEDSGPGLPAEVRAALADGQPGLALRGSDGTGLGLSLVRRICDFLGAVLLLSSRASGESVIEVRFPQDLTKS